MEIKKEDKTFASARVAKIEIDFRREVAEIENELYWEKLTKANLEDILRRIKNLKNIVIKEFSTSKMPPQDAYQNFLNGADCLEFDVFNSKIKKVNDIIGSIRMRVLLNESN